MKGVVSADSVAVISQFFLQFSFDVMFVTLLSLATGADLFAVDVFASATVEEVDDDKDFDDDTATGVATSAASPTSFV